YGLIWRSVLMRLGVRLDLRSCLRVYLASEFVRYIPGNVWHVLTRILWVGKYGVSRPVAFASMVIELITKLAAAALVFAVSLLFWPDVGNVAKLLHGAPIIPVLGVLVILALLVVLHPRVLSGMLNAVLRIFKREPVKLMLRYRDILVITLYWCVSWCIAGVAFFLLTLSIWPAAPLIILPLCIGVYALVWDIGFVSVITPSGLGVREGAMVLIFGLAFALPAGLAGVLALASRVVSTLAEILCVGLAYLSGGRQVRAIQLEQRAGTEKETQPAASSDNILEEEATQVGMEGGLGSD
ncbi:MAG: flippase-like domain-containing protein, partial [Ktedonobacteraceae bacterium]|nr:flippase-like domain-containing protein [Ktedonobacteraceae bacterium]